MVNTSRGPAPKRPGRSIGPGSPGYSGSNYIVRSSSRASRDYQEPSDSYNAGLGRQQQARTEALIAATPPGYRYTGARGQIYELIPTAEIPLGEIIVPAPEITRPADREMRTETVTQRIEIARPSEIDAAAKARQPREAPKGIIGAGLAIAALIVGVILLQGRKHGNR